MVDRGGKVTACVNGRARNIPSLSWGISRKVDFLLNNDSRSFAYSNGFRNSNSCRYTSGINERCRGFKCGCNGGGSANICIIIYQLVNKRTYVDRIWSIRWSNQQFNSTSTDNISINNSNWVIRTGFKINPDIRSLGRLIPSFVREHGSSVGITCWYTARFTAIISTTTNEYHCTVINFCHIENVNTIAFSY